MRGNSFAALIARPIREVVTVSVNGQRAGAVWTAPYRVDVTVLLRAGSNNIRIDVDNTAINQLAEGGRLPDGHGRDGALRSAPDASTRADLDPALVAGAWLARVAAEDRYRFPSWPPWSSS